MPIHLPSGNLLADRRFEWARDLAAKGDLAGAADLLLQALELAPGYAAAWFALGELREKLGERDGAIAAFAQARTADPQDRHGARLHLIRLGAQPAAAMPESYVCALFDGYAGAFDQALTQGLGYRAPELLLRAIEASGTRLKFGSGLDLGCGTGLAGAAFRPHCDWLVGVDLSPAMLAQARAKGLYDRLIEGDVAAFLAGEAAQVARYHLIVAADVFMYLDALAPVLTAVAQVAAPAATIAFSVETHDGDGVILRETLRYAHGAAHVRAALAAAGLQLVSLDAAATRTEKNAPVPGLIVVARAQSV
ncbi:MAG: methyltransferase domain-containing protein [Rhizobiales bacterium]|nr:methyltransferase domain-containing protein [Hyphomicrobiales bacterium]